MTEPAAREGLVTRRTKPGYLPDFGPDDCLWLVTVVGEWPVHAHSSESSAIHHMSTLRARVNDALERDHRVRVTKITIATYEELALQVEVVRESLVAKGAAVKS
jgi:hypothetical protein